MFHPKIRYSNLFRALANALPYSWAEEMLIKAMRAVEHYKLEGDYLEFGVYQGNTFIKAYHIAQMMGLSKMKFYAFDSFEGFPKDDSKELYAGKFACSVKDFENNVIKEKVNLNKVEIIKGFFKETLTKKLKAKLKIKIASVVYVDCSMYSSAIEVLRFATDYIKDGTVIAFDDWFDYKGNPNMGEQRAFKEWLKENKNIKVSEFHKFGVFGNSFIIHKKQRN